MSDKATIESLIAGCNAKTGAGATDLTAAIQALANGYGEMAVKTGTVTPTGNIVGSTNAVTITHGLGKIPKYIFVFAVDQSKITEETGVHYMAVQDCNAPYSGCEFWDGSKRTIGHSATNNNVSTAFNATTFTLRSGSTARFWKAGVTLRWVVWG